MVKVVRFVGRGLHLFYLFIAYIFIHLGWLLIF